MKKQNETTEDIKTEVKKEVVKIENKETKQGWKIISFKRRILISTFFLSVGIYLVWYFWNTDVNSHTKVQDQKEYQENFSNEQKPKSAENENLNVTDKETYDNPANSRKEMAIIIAEQTVSKTLEIPTSAAFCSDSEYIITNPGTGIWNIEGYVYSKNLKAEKTKSTFRLSLKFKNNGSQNDINNWEVLSLTQSK